VVLFSLRIVTLLPFQEPDNQAVQNYNSASWLTSILLCLLIFGKQQNFFFLNKVLKNVFWLTKDKLKIFCKRSFIYYCLVLEQCPSSLFMELINVIKIKNDKLRPWE
jgi:hypothetical protein